MSGYRWVVTPLRLSEALRSFWYGSSVYPCHLFLIFSASVRFILFLSLIVPIFGMKYSLCISNFLEEKRSPVFSILLFSSISLHCSLRKVLLSLLAIHWNSKFRWVYLTFFPLLFASLLIICNPSSDNHFAFLHFFFLGMPSRRQKIHNCKVGRSGLHFTFEDQCSSKINVVAFPYPEFNLYYLCHSIEMSHGLQIKCILFLNNIKELLFIFLFFDSQIVLKHSGIWHYINIMWKRPKIFTVPFSLLTLKLFKHS